MYDATGVVRLTREGEVRWTTWSIFHGQERWRSEGVQIGGVNSARGVLGNWFERYSPPFPSHPPPPFFFSNITAQRLRPSRPRRPNRLLESRR